MYEKYTRQALANRDYRELLGTTIYVFNSNNSFLIENFLNTDFEDEKVTWHTLVEKVSGNLSKIIRKNSDASSDLMKALDLFDDLTGRRNRIVHSFPVTNKEEEQILATKDKQNKQYYISKDYMMTFINDNEKLALMLDEIRNNRQKKL
ncbi:selenium binding protein [Leuconostoc lactis]